MTRLVSVKVDVSLQDGLGNVGNIVIDRPDNRMQGWRIFVRGPAVLLVSPPGWSQGLARALWSGTAVSIYEIDRRNCVLRWEGLDEIDSIQKYDSPEMWTTEDRARLEAAKLEAEIEKQESRKAQQAAQGGQKAKP